MNNQDFAREVRKQRRLEVLGTVQPRCGTCGENRWQCIEMHHVAGQKCDPDTTVLECRNCHRLLSDDQRSHPAFNPEADLMLMSIGHFLLGLADMLRVAIEKLYEFGLALIARSDSAEVLS